MRIYILFLFIVCKVVNFVSLNENVIEQRHVIESILRYNISINVTNTGCNYIYFYFKNYIILDISFLL